MTDWLLGFGTSSHIIQKHGGFRNMSELHIHHILVTRILTLQSFKRYVENVLILTYS